MLGAKELWPFALRDILYVVKYSFTTRSVIYRDSRENLPAYNLEQLQTHPRV